MAVKEGWWRRAQRPVHFCVPGSLLAAAAVEQRAPEPPGLRTTEHLLLHHSRGGVVRRPVGIRPTVGFCVGRLMRQHACARCAGETVAPLVAAALSPSRLPSFKPRPA